MAVRSGDQAAPADAGVASGKDGMLAFTRRLRHALRRRLRSFLGHDPFRRGRPIFLFAAHRRRAEAVVAEFYQAALHRRAEPWEVNHWVGEYESGRDILDIWALIAGSPEAKALADPARADDGELILDGYEIMLGRCARAAELSHWRALLSAGRVRPDDVVLSLFRQSRHERNFVADVRAGRASIPGHPVLGREALLTERDWHARSSAAEIGPAPSRASHAKLPIKLDGKRIKVSIICSVYKGATYIETYMRNIVSQSVFDDCCELIIVDAASPDGEIDIIAPYIDRFPGRIVYERLPYRATIYDAWNIAIGRARGDYVTNANLDDRRREDSIEIQCGILDRLDFVDVVYQDVIYTLDWNLPFAAAMRRGFTSDLPIITPQNLLAYNSPHNAPMWRRRLHDDVGMFDATLRSAGDWQFWMRCLLADKTFYKINDPHVLYYVNAEGLSTAVGGVALEEGYAVTRRLGRRLLPEDMKASFPEFVKRCGATAQPAATESEPEEGRYAFVHGLMRDAAYAAERSARVADGGRG